MNKRKGLSLCLLLLLPLCSQADNLRLQLASPHSFQFAGYYAAVAKGFYQQKGLEVALQEAAPEASSADIVNRGDAEFGVGTSSLLLDRQHGKPLVVLAPIFQHSALALVARADHPLPNLHNLAGKTLMLQAGTEELEAYLIKQGLEPSRYHSIPHSGRYGDLLDGKVDAMSAYTNYAFYQFAHQLPQLHLYSPRAAGIDFYGDNLFTRADLIRHRPQLVADFLEASLLGWRYALDNQEELISLIQERYNTNLSKEILRLEAAQVHQLISPEFIDLGNSQAGRWRHIADTYAELGLLPRDFALDGLLYQQPSERQNTWFYLALASGIGLLLLVVVALHIYRINSKLKNMVQRMRRADVQQRTHNEVLGMIAADDPLEDILRSLVEGVERQNPQMLCSVLLYNPQTRRLRLGAAPSLPDFYNRAIEQLTVSETAGSCGAAVFTGKRVVVSDIKTHPNWVKYRDLTDEAGLAACWSEPINNRQGGALGSFAIYHRYIAEPSADEIKLIEECAYLAEIAIARKQALDALRESEERHRMLAQHDNLTGLPNRALFSDRLLQALNYAKRQNTSLAVLLLDLDNFKPVNDTYGHALGDELLRSVAQRLRDSVRTSDTVARIGGDEFVILLQQIESPEQAMRLGEKIEQRLSAEFWLEEQSLYIGCSLGIALSPQDSSDPRELTKIADQRMYAHKERKRAHNQAAGQA